jgi:hypothetical protein
VTDTDWPYDADQDDPLTALRIPVTSLWPGWKYVATFDRDSAVRPTDAEAAILASFIAEYKAHWYFPHYSEKLLERPFDIDSGQVTTIFHKRGEDDWAYRVATWEYGPMLVPERSVPALPLVALMDRIHTIGDEPMGHWLEWKAAHPDVFAEASNA